MVFRITKDFKHIARVSISEAIGTAFLACLCCMATIDSELPLVEKALASGLSVCAVIHGIGHISGAHVNPSVTVASVISGALPLYLAPYYIISQCIGAIVGTFVFAQFSAIYPLSPTVCMCLPHPNISVFKATMIEVMTTSILILANCATWDHRNSKNTDSNPLKFGFLVTMVKLTTLELTGASMNPATALGAVVLNNYWEHHWIYWVGPLSGSILTAVLYRLLFAVPTQEQILLKS